MRQFRKEKIMISLSYRANVEAIIETNLPQIKDEVKETMVNRIVELYSEALFDSLKKEIENMINEDYIPCTGGYVVRTLPADPVIQTIDKYRKEFS